MRCFDETGRSRVVVECFPELADGDLEHTVAHEGVTPGRRDQVLFRDELSRTPEQMFEDGECLGSQLDG
jgi:hypothetical protein